ncbi:MAG: low specificity L-threonine aldolase [Acidobacteria bacterium]|nr:low specificity L-threonine aldolase [Acidobacteriota bacterium]
MDSTIDFRSDTVTKPSPAMRRAMAEAEVGDDVMGEDPTVRKLEERACELLGKPAAVFVPTGTMGNQAALKAHTNPGEEIICDERSHIVLYEMGMVAAFSGCMTRTIASPDGLLSWASIEPRMRRGSDHYRGVTLIEVENTHNAAGGRIYPLETLAEIAAKARPWGAKVHMDGARLFNAAAAMDVSPATIVESVDSVSFCLSKGLGAPVGSVLAGEEDFIERARLVRKGLGGGMRQSGVIAAAGLVALDETPPMLPCDHENARYIAAAFANMDKLAVENPVPETNILFFRTVGELSEEELLERLRRRGVLALMSGGRIRIVTHRDVSRKQCEEAVDAVTEALREG